MWYNVPLIIGFMVAVNLCSKSASLCNQYSFFFGGVGGGVGGCIQSLCQDTSFSSVLSLISLDQLMIFNR